MMHHSSLWIRSTLTIASAITLSSCVYDPGYYYNTPGGYSGAVSTTYSSSGHSSTSLFISTGNPRWGYDPSCYSYYDYTTRCYYDPYLNGYYPYGYRPPVIIGVPHPYGWRPGYRTCPSPRHYRNTRLSNHEHRDIAYRNLNQSWSRNVHVQSSSNDRYDRNRSFSSDRYNRDRYSPNTATSMNRSAPVNTIMPTSRDRDMPREIRRPSGSSWNPNTNRDFNRSGTRPSTPSIQPGTPGPSRERQPRVESPAPPINPSSSVQYRQSREPSFAHRSHESRQSFQGSQSGSNHRSAPSYSARPPVQTRETRHRDAEIQKPEPTR